MRQTAIVVTLLASAPMLAAGQMRREPLIVAAPFAVINPWASPVELAEGTVEIGGRDTPPMLIRFRSKDPTLQLSAIVVRLAAGLFDDGMVTYRLQMGGSLSTPDSQSLSADPAGWTIGRFERKREDALPAFGHVRRGTRFLLTIELVTDNSGRVVFDNGDTREQLWKALGGL